MNPDLFLADLEAKPGALRELAATLDAEDPYRDLPSGIERVLFLGMGSSRYAAGVAALRLRAAGIDAVAEYASALPYATTTLPPRGGVSLAAGTASSEAEVAHGLGAIPPGAAPGWGGRSRGVAGSGERAAAATVGPRGAGPAVGGPGTVGPGTVGPGTVRAGTVVVAISATGGSRETLEALAAVEGPVVVVTNDVGSAVAARAGLVVPMVAGEEQGGVACRSFQHTVALLLALEARLTGGGSVVPLVRKAAEATEDLLDRRDAWLPRTLELLDGPHGVYAIAPAERLSSAEQSALMVREGPRRPADACETGDWAHVDVYLTKTLDYRALLFPGSRYDEQAMEWMRSRGSTVVAVGGEVEGAAAVIRYKRDEDPLVRLLTETLVAELMAAHWWRLVS